MSNLKDLIISHLDGSVFGVSVERVDWNGYTKLYYDYKYGSDADQANMMLALQEIISDDGLDDGIRNTAKLLMDHIARDV